MKRAGMLIVLVLLLVPLFSSAKSLKLAGFERDKGKEITVSEPLGWPISISASSHVKGTIESLPGMTVVRLLGYGPWWKIWSDLPATTTITISGLPKNATLHVYTRGYREHQGLATDARGTLTLAFDSDSGAQFIIKQTPSTKHIALGLLFGPPGGDCGSIGTWTALTWTCKLNQDVFETIAIEDSGITLDGNNFSVRGTDSGDGIYTDESDVRITNIEVHRFDRGIVYSDSLFTLASGGQIDGTTLADNILNIMDEGVSNLRIIDNDIVVASTGLSLVDQLDGFATDGIVIIRNSFKQNNNDLFNSGTSFILNTVTDRGNWWAKNTNCTQDPGNPNHCTNSYNEGDGTDNAPWACENAWRAGVICPFTPLASSGSWAEVSGSTGTVDMYKESSASTKIKTLPNGWALKIIDGSIDPIKVEDVTDASVGYVRKNNLVTADVASTKETQLKNDAEIIYDTKSKRAPLILVAVDLYHTDTNSIKLLYSASGGLDGADNFQTYHQNLNFPKELHLAVIAQESGGSEFNNNKCSYAGDGGIGISQITTPSYKGLGSGMRNSAHLNDCVGNSGEGLYYGNTYQGIYANIKDGFRVFQEKYSYAPIQKALTSATTTFFDNGTLTINKKDMATLLAIRAYNGFQNSVACQRLNVPNTYLLDVSNRLLNLGSYFTGISYDDTAHESLAAKLKLANDNKTDIYTCSPVYLQLFNASKELTGWNGTTVVNNTSEVVYDDAEHRSATILFHGDAYSKLQVIGAETGIYDLYVDRTISGITVTATAQDIPVGKGEVHRYIFDWPALLEGKFGITISVDQNGDGTFEKTFKSGLTVNKSAFAGGKGKVIVCHIPAGNPTNAHTINVNQNAVVAHLGHGDTKGACQTATSSPAKVKTNMKKK